MSADPDESSQRSGRHDLRDQLRPAGDQGRRGTCVAFAVTAVHEANRGPVDASESEPTDLAEEVLFWGAKQIDGDSGEGTRFTSAHLALQRWGQPAEALWPYDEHRDHRVATYHPPPAAIDPTHCHLSALRPLAADANQIIAELDAGRPVVVGIPIWDALRRADTEPLPPPDPADIHPTKHAVVVVGHDAADPSLLIRNSWGRGWGNEGHLWVDAGLLNFATGAWVIDTGTTAAPVTSADEEVLT